MTRRDFELIAATIKAQRWQVLSADQKNTLDNLARDFADKLKATNAQFNRDKFLHACGVQS